MSQPSQRQPWVVAITGASGTVYARTLVRQLLTHVADLSLDIVISEAGMRVLREEEGLKCSQNAPDPQSLFGTKSDRLRFHHFQDIGAGIASGSYPAAGMIVVPCSMSSLAAIASGVSSNLIHRAAEVTLKEGRPLIVVPRETPLSAIQLENMLKLARLGVRVVPAMPGFYHQPQQIEELVDMLVMRIADQMGFQLPLARRWKSDEAEL